MIHPLQTHLTNHQYLEEQLDVVIVRAGAAGIGCAVALQYVGVKKWSVIERSNIGASFERWPQETRFITPSFPSNGFGLLDLNSIALHTSPAYSLKKEHLNGPDYARYLQGVADYFQLPVDTGVNVVQLRPDPQREGFILETSQGVIYSRFVIWAAGEFQYPRLDTISGADLALHTSFVHSWQDLEGSAFLIVEGNESGIDAAIHLVALGKRVLVLDTASIWQNEEADPSLALSPFTQERLREALQTGHLELVGEKPIKSLVRTPAGFAAEAISGERYLTPTRPLLATGFSGSLALIAYRFAWDDEGYVHLTDEDESTLTPGLFVVGPFQRSKTTPLCFIYKFRQRFAVVAHAIAQHLELSTEPLQHYHENGMFLDDLSCCGDECKC